MFWCSHPACFYQNAPARLRDERVFYRGHFFPRQDQSQEPVAMPVLTQVDQLSNGSEPWLVLMVMFFCSTK